LEHPWGDSIVLAQQNKNEKIRLLFWNCGGFPPNREHPKNHIIRTVINNAHADIAAFAEVNISWKNVKPHDRLQERTWGWFRDLHTSMSYASNFPTPTPSLVGGTAIFTINDYVHRVDEKTSDSMGRWCSTRLKGKGHTALRIISAYRCVKNIYGPLSVWNQQKYLLDLQNISKDPIDQFDEDLKQFLVACLQVGEHLILAIDANSDTRFSSFTQLLNSIG
jgi:hypothetical protein